MAQDAQQDIAAGSATISTGHLRAMTCVRGLLQRADGSVQWSQEGTSVIAAVYGPQAAQARSENDERAIVEVVFKPRSGLAGTAERQYEHLIRRAAEGVLQLTLFPRTQISIVLQVVRDDGSLLACALNAACGALIDARVPMMCLFVAMACALHDESRVVPDPNAAIEQAALACTTVAYPVRSKLPEEGGLTVDKGVLTAHTVGALSVEGYLAVLEISRTGCEHVARHLRSAMS